MFVTDIGEEIVIEVEDSGQGFMMRSLLAYSIKASRRKKARSEDMD